MKWIAVALLVFCFNAFHFSYAQQRLEPGAMNYVSGNKPNSIIYRDTLYQGSARFRFLFYRTHDQELIRLCQKHQSHKIAGQVLGFAGTLATIIGIGKLSSGDNKSLGWALTGGGFVAVMGSGYLTLLGQQKLGMAVSLFNLRYHQAGIGVSGSRLGFVYKF